MSALLATTFSALQGAAIALAAVNAVVLAAALVCLFYLYRSAEKESEEKETKRLRSRKRTPKA